MPPEQFINRIETEVLDRPLGAVEQWVIKQSLQRQSYGYMARNSNYSLGYLKIVGSTLWNELSTVLGSPITKKNIEFIFLASGGLAESAGSTSATHHSLSSVSWQGVVRQRQKLRESELSELDPCKPSLVYPGGPVPLDSLFYIERTEVEAQAYQELQQPGALLRVRGPAKTGKTSLMMRLLHNANQLGYRTVSIDFQSIDQAFLEDRDRFFRWLCANIGNQLQSALKVDDIWDDDLGANVLCTAYLEAVALNDSEVPLLILFNAIDRVLSYKGIYQDFLSLIRFWYEQAKQHRRWRVLRQALTHSTEVYVPLSLDRSPFNVGLSLRLPPFTLHQAHELARRYGFGWAFADNASEPLEQLIQLTGGHPYLLRLALHRLAQSNVTLSELLVEARRPDGFYRQHVQQQFAMLSKQRQLFEALQQIMSQADSQRFESSTLDREMLYHLECAGLIAMDGHSVKLSCDLYRMHFQNMELVS